MEMEGREIGEKRAGEKGKRGREGRGRGKDDRDGKGKRETEMERGKKRKGMWREPERKGGGGKE